MNGGDPPGADRVSTELQYTGTTLVTGANGFLGRHLVDCLVRDGSRVRAAVLPSEDANFLAGLEVEVVRADLRVVESLAPLFRGQIDRVFHLGAICNFSTPYSVLRTAPVP